MCQVGIVSDMTELIDDVTKVVRALSRDQVRLEGWDVEVGGDGLDTRETEIVAIQDKQAETIQGII